MTDYNYTAFSAHDYEFRKTHGPGVGEKAPDFLLDTLDGSKRRLLDFDAELLVLELGSVTCPLFQSRRRQMQALTALSPRVQSAILYVREAHPGSAVQPHLDMDDKTGCARLLSDDGETRLVLIDGVEGAAHRAFGSLPNAVYVINRAGCVVFRGDWNNAGATRAAVEALLEGRPVNGKSYFRPATPAVVLRTFRRAGEGSALDFFKSLPALIWHNLIVRNLRTLFGRSTAAGLDVVC